jgi:hypothetical protein
VADDAMGTAEDSSRSLTALRTAVTGLRELHLELQARLETTSDPAMIELVAYTTATVRRLIRELDPDERLRRQLRLSRAQRPVAPRLRHREPPSGPLGEVGEAAPTAVFHPRLGKPRPPD